MKRVLLVFVVVLCCLVVTFAQTKRGTLRYSEQKLITDLVSSQTVAGVFGDDGMRVFFQTPELKQILGLGKRAIPLLIAHLDDNRLLQISTNYPDGSGGHYRVTVGAACFDILTYIIRQDSRFFDRKCLKELEDGSISSCVRSGYAILPEDFWLKSKLRAHKSVLRAKQNWATAFRKHQIRYQAH